MRILGCLVCRGSPKDKALIMSRIICNNVPFKWKLEDEDLFRNDERLKRCLRLILYNSIVLPTKFLSVHRYDRLFWRILGRNKDIAQSQYENKMTMFTEAYVHLRENKFEEWFESLYNERILDSLFSRGCTMTKHSALLSQFETESKWSISLNLFRNQ